MWSKIKLAIILVHKIIINWIIWPDQNWIRCRSAEAIGWNWLSSQNLNAHFSYRASNRIRRSIMQDLSWYILLHKTKKYLHHYCHHVPNSGISIVQLCTLPPNVRRRNMLDPCTPGFTNQCPFSCKKDIYIPWYSLEGSSLPFRVDFKVTIPHLIQFKIFNENGDIWPFPIRPE